jgi:spore coat polysaccharide biosynthesis protein SpsF (cytidylyltransferase family)
MPIKKKWNKNFLPRLTVDEKSDFRLAKKISKHFNKKKENIYFSYKQILDYLEKNKNLLKINSNIMQKKFKGING